VAGSKRVRFVPESARPEERESGGGMVTETRLCAEMAAGESDAGTAPT